MKSYKPSPFIVHVFSTSAASVATVVSNIFVIRFLAKGLGAEKFGAYSLSNRLFSILVPFATLMMGLTLTRYLSISKEPLSKAKYLLSGSFLGVLPSLVILTLGFTFKDSLSLLIFHHSGYESLFSATLFLITAYSIYAVVNGVYFGKGEILKSNQWQIGLGVIGPLAVAFLFSRTGKTEIIVFFLAISYLTAIVPYMAHLLQAASLKGVQKNLAPCIRELISYGSPRVLGAFLITGLLSLAPFLAPYFSSLQDAGYLLVGQSIFRIAELGTSAFGMVSLPKTGQWISEDRHDYLKDRITDILTFIFHAGLFLSLQIFLWSDEMISLWLGDAYHPASLYIKILSLGIIPYTVYVMLSSTIDAMEHKPMNVLHLFIAFLSSSIVCLTAGRLFSAGGLAAGTVSGFLTLGLLTVSYLWRAYRFNFKSFFLKEVLFLNFFFLAAGFLLKRFVASLFPSPNAVILFLELSLGVALFLASYIYGLWRLRPRWIGELEKRLFTPPHGKLAEKAPKY